MVVNRRERGVRIGAWVPFDAAADAVQIEVRGASLRWVRRSSRIGMTRNDIEEERVSRGRPPRRKRIFCPASRSTTKPGAAPSAFPAARDRSLRFNKHGNGAIRRVSCCGG